MKKIYEKFVEMQINTMKINNFIVFIEILTVIITSFIMIKYKIHLWEIIVFLFNGLILIEIFRMIFEYIGKTNHIIKIRIAIDGFIVFFLRDIVIVFNNEKYTMIEREHKLILVCSLVLFLFLCRILSTKFSPNRENEE